MLFSWKLTLKLDRISEPRRPKALQLEPGQDRKVAALRAFKRSALVPSRLFYT
jgi:hypothetical protein